MSSSATHATAFLNTEDHPCPPSDKTLERKYASPPFDGRCNGYITIQTSDRVWFQVHEVILSLASPYFNDLFEDGPLTPLPSPDPSQRDFDNAGDTTLVADDLYHIDEDSKVFDIVLRCIWPGLARPTLSSLDDLLPVLDAMVRYEMDQIDSFQHIITSLLRLAKPPSPGKAHPNPLRVFARFHKHKRSFHQPPWLRSSDTAWKFPVRYRVWILS
ncbi:hypothetical protein PM082_019976 [Marasmius tenuissimus]|nr:hypothetical protein PM082_019976 [Marasmius tenuissimus]